MTVTEIKLSVQIQPNAKRNEIISFVDNILHLKIAAPPVEGKANRELIEFLSEMLDIRKSDVVVDKGAASKKKILIIRGLSPDKLAQFTNQYRKADCQKRLL
jgi:uncharacterized protein